MTMENISQFADMIGYHFNDPAYLQKALTHRSYHNENPKKSVGHNERLEFLGDAVLDLVISEKIFSLFPDLEEGQLSKIRAGLVNESGLCRIAKKMNLGQHMMLGKGEEQTHGNEKPRLLSSTLEALIGAIYLDGGMEPVKVFLFKYFEGEFKSDISPDSKLGDHKTQLQELTQKYFKKIPKYKLLSEDGPDHAKVFSVSVSLNGKELGVGKGKTKKVAEQVAAAKAIENLEIEGA